MSKSKIEWLNMPGRIPKTWNMIYGCSHASDGCRNCYAERMANRQKHMALAKIAAGKNPGKSANYIEVIGNDGKWNGEVRFDEEVLRQPLKWRKPCQVFPCSMCDLFHESVPGEWIAKVYQIMADTPQHTYMVLTKRIDRAKEVLDGLFPSPLKNLWMGVTCENQEQADRRIPDLLATPAAHRFVSVEPMLESVWIHKCDLKKLDYLVVGCESGPGARLMLNNWVRDIRTHCAEAGVPFMFKQAKINGKLVKMPELDGVVHDAERGQ